MTKKPEKKPEATNEIDLTERLMVAVRVRPLTKGEISKGWYKITNAMDEQFVHLQEPEVNKHDHLRKNRVKDKDFAFDTVFGENSTQEEVYKKTTMQLVNNVLQGYNATVFAYGATGAGKTYTMAGTPENPGIMVRALNALFNDMKKKNRDYEISMSYLEIYNESIRDLLNPSSGTLELREDNKTGVIQVAGLSESTTTSTQEVMRLLQKGNKVRTCEPTEANKTSSRSHALLQVALCQYFNKSTSKQETLKGKLYMIDLAGSERARETKNQGQRLIEGAHINRSLLALGNCIHALAEGRAKYVNYRDSKLTRLLKDALSGNCRTVMIAHVSPAHVHREESRNTLIYADRAKNILKKVRPNAVEASYQISQKMKIIADLKDKISQLETKISDYQSTSSPPAIPSPESDETSKARMRKLKEDIVSLFREQMNLRNKIMEIDNNILALSMEFERQNLVVTEWEAEKVRRKGKLKNKKNENEKIIMDVDGENDLEDDEEEPEEVAQAWEDLVFLQTEQQRYADMRDKVEQEMMDAQKKAEELEEMLFKRECWRKKLKKCRKRLRKSYETLPDQITTEEQRELLALLCKVHELEIEKVEMESEALIKEHELRRRDLLILRYDRQKTLSDEIINRQKAMIDDLSSSLPPELQELYALYKADIENINPEKETRYMNELNSLFRSPSMQSLRIPSIERLPPICNNNGSSNKEQQDKLFEKPARRYSLSEDRRPDTPLSLRSTTSSASGSSPVSLPPGSKVPSLPPIRGQQHSWSTTSDSEESKNGSMTIASRIHDSRFSDKPASIEGIIDLETALARPERRRSVALGSQTSSPTSSSNTSRNVPKGVVPKAYSDSESPPSRRSKAKKKQAQSQVVPSRRVRSLSRASDQKIGVKCFEALPGFSISATTSEAQSGSKIPSGVGKNFSRLDALQGVFIPALV